MDVDKFKRLVELNINVNEEENINEIASRMVDSIVKCVDIVASRKAIVIKVSDRENNGSRKIHIN